MKSKKEISNFYDDFFYDEFENIAPWHSMIIDYLKENDIKDKKLLDVGCYRWFLFKRLVEKFNWNKDNLYWMDISAKSLEYAKKNASNIYELDVEKKESFKKFDDETFDIIVATEIIEHIEDFSTILYEWQRILKKWWIFILSFPNYINIFWYLRKKTAEILNKPEMMYIQPIEKKYTYFYIKKRLKKHFKIIWTQSSLYFPRFLLKFESPRVIKILEKMGLTFFSFSPMFICKKD